ncbi:MAG: EAL domain-containing protein [Gemmatimonadetes bacterium]|nr:EAL domain-containing protein [Gemmatimonadota bacterium]
MPDPGLLYAMYLGQAGLAAALAGLLAWFYRLYGRDYLRQWAASWVAFTVYLGGAAAGFWLAIHAPGQETSRLALTFLVLASGDLQIGFLLLGASELRTGRPVTRRRTQLVLLAFFLLAVATTFVYVGLPPGSPGRSFLRIGVRALAAATAFVGTAWWVGRSPVWPAGAGRRVVAVAFTLYALEQIQYFVATLLPLAGGTGPAYVTYLGFVDFVLQAIIGLGMLVGLLEQERARVVAAANEIERLVYHDTSTDLPNRRMLVDYLTHAVARAQRTGERVALAHLDVDRFNLVNEAWSQAVGDAVLRGIGDRLRALLRETDMVAHLGGDSFAVLVTGHAGDQQLLAVTERMAQRIRQPFVLHEREIQLTASIGVARHPDHGTDAETLLRSADTAMFRAKEGGRNRTLFYQPTMNERAREKQALERALRRAIGSDELVLHFQPIVALGTGRIVSFEALLRWQHPERGLLGPSQFLPVVETIGLSDAVDQWVLRTACTEAFRWRELSRGRRPHVAVNLSAVPLQDPGLVRRIETVLADTGLPASALELEITESAAMQHAEGTLDILRGLKRLGVHISIDDFGTGYSSLSYLRTFPIDTIKIDRAFVRDLGVQENARTLIAGIIALASSMRLAVVAEGVETEVQRAILSAEGCGLLQGYLVGVPLPAAECVALMEAQPASVDRAT